MTSAVAYCRISKDDQGTALGVDRQEKLCRKLAHERGLDLIEVLVDNDVSAYRQHSRRPAFERLVAMLDNGKIGAVVTYHTDRLYRRTTDLERLVSVIEATQVQVHTVAAGNVDLTNASGRMVARMLGAAAQGESERMGERIRAKHDELAAAGKPPGGRPPYGYSKGYEVNRQEADALRFMARRVLEGGSLLRIARELDDRGISTREGRKWAHSTVRAVLVNPAVAGLRVHRREIAGPGQWEPVLDRSTWEQVRTLLSDPARKRSRPATRYLLAGLVETVDGDRMNGAPVDGRSVYTTRMPTGRGMSISTHDLDATITEAVLATLDRTALPAPAPATSTIDVTAIEAELAELAELRGAGQITLGEWMAARKPLQERLAAAKASAAPRRPERLSRLLEQPGAARAAWPSLDFDTRRQIIASLVERVVVAPASRGRWSTVVERLDPANGGNIVWKA